MKKISTLLHILSLSVVFLCLPIPSLSGFCNKDDKKVLLEIDQSFGKAGFTSWVPSIACCDWYGVECDPTTHRIVTLSFFKFNLSGQIPAAIGDLPYLQNLLFHKLSNITGTIPSSFTKLSHISLLRLTWLNLSGPVPSFLSELKSLTDLDLSFNQFTGSIPPSLSTLTNLLVLHLDRNKLTGTIPDSFGKFTGSIPDLYLSHNNLTGPVPESLGNLNFTNIDFSRNKLSGDLSFLFGANKAIQVADFSRNVFEFDLTNVVFPASLISLDLNHNKIFGSLPEGLTGISLQFFNVSYNRLCGQIPVGGKLQSFGVTEYFHNKCLCGAPLPAC